MRSMSIRGGDYRDCVLDLTSFIASNCKRKSLD